MPQHATTQQDNDNKKNNELNIVENVAEKKLRQTTPKRYSMPRCKVAVHHN
jgi:hypothetical protein